MAKKQNAGIQIDREAIATFQVYVAAEAAEVSRLTDELKPSVAYLVSEENIDGGDSEGFREACTRIQTGLVTINEKFTTLDAITRKMSEVLGNVASTSKRSIEQAREDLNARIFKLAQEKKGGEA